MGGYKKVNVQDTKTCYVGMNGDQNQPIVHKQEYGTLKSQQNRGCHY